jgi:hypothetical protein
VVELATQQEAVAQPEVAALQDQVIRLESKLIEQERTIRQTLTMLIEWIETEMDQSKAA